MLVDSPIDPFNNFRALNSANTYNVSYISDAPNTSNGCNIF